MTPRLPKYLGSLQQYLDRLAGNPREHGDTVAEYAGPDRKPRRHESTRNSRLALSKFPGQIGYKLRHTTGPLTGDLGGLLREQAEQSLVYEQGEAARHTETQQS